MEQTSKQDNVDKEVFLRWLLITLGKCKLEFVEPVSGVCGRGRSATWRSGDVRARNNDLLTCLIVASLCCCAALEARRGARPRWH